MFEILPYNKELDQRLDRFVNRESVNGTFLQTRQFLNYHPEDRFKDASFAIHKSGIITAYFPGTVTADGEFISHQGSTFGGPVISKDFYTASRLQEILKFADEYFAKNFRKVRLKLTPAVFSQESPALVEYLLEHLGYERHTELSAVTTIVSAPDGTFADPFDLCEGAKRRQVKAYEKYKAEHKDIIYRPIEAEELGPFYEFLKISKAKYNVKPVHSIEEIKDLASARIADNIWLRGIFGKDETGRENLIAGAMFFVFPETKAVHYQYIAPDPSFDAFNPTVAVLTSIMREAATKGFKNVSWGISTEDGGKYLNETLFKFKEGLGGKASLNTYYTKNF
ncbi:Acetyltransferase (GNAT) domain-containing protein [Fibrobacter sp. UWH9]|uniref:GNAT family N-acetyltransferase n=1 Tax=Fibrobacter sp. UWH9 TaxID=1896213 RepID=UPI0009117674|nr:GNAT family N-acetyltransferase [Fibrobacter sp. UWH9]SHG91416.1 Acetyltransferase (GNAT) domain-containing protein [Fibrobacter sp. UWH9]